MRNRPYTEAFLQEKNLNLRLQRKDGGSEYWQITNEKEWFVLDFMWYAETPGDPNTEMVKFFVNTTLSSEQFPRRNPARKLFHTTNALLWFDTLTHVLYQDLGEYTCAIKTGATDAPYFERKGYDRLRPDPGTFVDRYTLTRRIDSPPQKAVDHPALPEKTLSLLDDIQMRYIPQEKLFVTDNRTGRRRYTHADIDQDRCRVTTTFNSANASKEYPRLVKDPQMTPLEYLVVLERIVASIAEVHGPIELTLLSGHKDADLLTQNGYTKAHRVRSIWCKTITP